MTQYIIYRTASNNYGTFGSFWIDEKPVCLTLEETWLNNLPRESCVPEGVYEVEKYSGTKYKNVWILKNVPGRSDILIHWGNTERNTAGCILMGKYYADFRGVPGVADSVKTIEMLRKMLPNKFHLTIIDQFR